MVMVVAMTVRVEVSRHVRLGGEGWGAAARFGCRMMVQAHVGYFPPTKNRHNATLAIDTANMMTLFKAGVFSMRACPG